MRSLLSSIAKVQIEIEQFERAKEQMESMLVSMVSDKMMKELAQEGV